MRDLTPPLPAPHPALAPTLTRPRRAAARLATIAALALLAACGGTPRATPSATDWQALLPADVLLIGEQHDAPDHQRLQREAVATLAGRGQLAALVMEMAEAGHGTAGLPHEASEATVREALAWNDKAWPWTRYGPVAMEAVRAGVPVLGGNLPRARMREAMHDSAWDVHLPAGGFRQQIATLREGHCGLLPEAQLPAMARIQIARDASLARTAADARRPGQTVLLVAGAGHVRRDLGVPTHWGGDVRARVLIAQPQSAQEAWPSRAADLVLPTPALPPQDHCATLRPPAPAGAGPRARHASEPAFQNA
ncbi:ChaN family lipoprotein [Acidovorax sp. NCPPB 2350]|nr:ChaN family lipoprotein [Acidovorax sp. NCPPB 2350]